MESDANYWSKFFSFDSRKFAKNDDEITAFLLDIYAPLFAAIERAAIEVASASPLTVYSFILATENAIAMRTAGNNTYDDDDDSSVADSKRSDDANSTVSDTDRFKSSSMITSSTSASKRKKAPPTAEDVDKSDIIMSFFQSILSSLSRARTLSIKAYAESLSKATYNVKYAPPFQESYDFAVTNNNQAST